MADLTSNITTDNTKAKGSYEFSDISTYGDLKKVIKSVTTKQKASSIGGGIKGKATDVAIDAAVEALKATIPGIGLAKHAYDIFRGAIKKPDTEKTNTWLDKLDIDDEMSKIVDDTIENGFIQAMTKTIESEPDDKPLESDFNMNAKMVNYLKQQYNNRTVAGITENKMKLKEYIKQLVRELLDEMSTSGDAGAYSTPFAFAKKGQGPNAATKQAQRSGWKLAGGMPKNSKVLDYKEIWKGKKSAMNENNIEFKVGDKVKYENQDWEIEKILDRQYRLKNLKGLPSVNVLKAAVERENKKSSMNETLKKLIEQELLNEVTYSKFKKDVKHRTKSEQLHKAIREVKRKLAEIDRIVEYTSRMKQELSEDEGGISYWKATQSNIGKISEIVNQLNNKIKNLHQ